MAKSKKMPENGNVEPYQKREVKDDTLIGYKKLFLMSNATEKKEVLCDELRCYGPTAENTFSGSILSSGRFIEQQHALSEDIYDTCIYNGADFTAPQFRSQGINKALTDAALRDIHDEVLAHIKANNAKFITMVYGLTQSNAGDIPGGQTDRTIGISKAFSMFAQSLGVDQNATTVHARYKAFMPTFDLQSNILQPLPDNQSIPGFGCVLTYALRQDHE